MRWFRLDHLLLTCSITFYFAWVDTLLVAMVAAILIGFDSLWWSFLKSPPCEILTLFQVLCPLPSKLFNFIRYHLEHFEPTHGTYALRDFWDKDHVSHPLWFFCQLPDTLIHAILDVHISSEHSNCDDVVILAGKNGVIISFTCEITGTSSSVCSIKKLSFVWGGLIMLNNLCFIFEMKKRLTSKTLQKV